MKPKRDSIVETAPFNAGRTEQIPINLGGYITQIDVTVELTVDKGTSPATGLDSDAALRAINALEVTASNWKSWISYVDGRQGFWLSYLKSQGNAICEGLTETASDTDTVTIQFMIHPGSNAGNTKDVSRVIPLRNMSNVQLNVTWAAADAIASGYTITDGELSIRVHRMILEPGERESEAFAGTDYLLVPRYIPQTYGISQALSNYSFVQNLPTGAYLRDLFMLVTDTNDKRSNTDVTQFIVEDNKGELYIKEDSFVSFVRSMRQNLYLPETPTGVGIVMFKDVTGKEYGLDMTAASLGDYKLAMTTEATGGKVLALYEGTDMVDIDPAEVG